MPKCFIPTVSFTNKVSDMMYLLKSKIESIPSGQSSFKWISAVLTIASTKIYFTILSGC